MKKTTLLFSAALLSSALVPSGASWGGVIPSDGSNIAIPEQLTSEVKIKAAYNGENIFWHFEWPTEAPNYYHDMLVYQDGKWVRRDKSGIGSKDIYEDRMTMMVSGGQVAGFAQQGCYMACHAELRFMNGEPAKGDMEAVFGNAEVKKYVLESRQGENWYDAPWDKLKSEDELASLYKAGTFLDEWQWRAHRGGPIGYVDNESWFATRSGTSGKGAFSTNWDNETDQPRYMLDAEKHGSPALRLEKLLNKEYGLNDTYYLETAESVPFDPSHKWQNGDAIPRRALAPGHGARSAITSKSTYEDGHWKVQMKRKMDTGFDDHHSFTAGRTYDATFAVHANSTGTRWHYISHPQKIGVGVNADIKAHHFEGEQPDWSKIEPVTLPLWYPGQVTWEWLTSDSHPGANNIIKDNKSCASCHGDSVLSVEKLARASASQELRSANIGSANLFLTFLTSLLVLVGGTFAVLSMTRRNK